jgi:hypothetical protein
LLVRLPAPAAFWKDISQNYKIIVAKNTLALTKEKIIIKYYCNFLLPFIPSGPEDTKKCWKWIVEGRA